jgi:hypothetical protein
MDYLASVKTPRFINSLNLSVLLVIMFLQITQK